ncbi:hypothetical protein Ocin01_08577 [Orchesella cincta]|uniref:Uncharacterized protein n=1 Tax=Orchesella cincta TaxID=48709 RepID=A0A1D2MYI6_ORCCI|nr:hypothetical protein Ocin01_08577 [Orchesella cincta]
MQCLILQCRPIIYNPTGKGGHTIGVSRNVSPSPFNAAQRESIPATEIEETPSKAPEQGPIAYENPQNDLLAAVGLTLKNSTALKPGIPCTITSANEAESSTLNSSQNNGSSSSEASFGDDCPAPNLEERRPLRSWFRSTIRAKESEAPVNVTSLEKRETSWGIIAPVGLVFARWEDDWFYSAKVKCSGELPNRWVIVFDDGVEYTAYTSDILPVSILGEGTIVNYPADSVRPRDGTIIGQQVEWNSAAKPFSVKYALQLQGQKEPIWAKRSELCFTETIATRLQIQYELAKQAQAKAEKISTSNGRKTREGNKKK